jgi:hypothetical protein
MDKRINRISVIFWVVGLLVMISVIAPIKAVIDFAAISRLSEDAQIVNQGVVVHVWREVTNALVKGGGLIGLGVLIELMDQIRWNALPAERRVGRKSTLPGG